VIIPVFNGEKTVSRCLDSLVRQTVFSKTEIIVVDDGSTDSTPAIIDSYSLNCENIIAIHKKNMGVSAAKNSGIEAAGGDYIIFTDSDDFVDDNFLECMLQRMDDGIDIVCTGFIADYSSRYVTRCSEKEYALSAESAVKELLIEGYLDPHVTDKLFRRKLLDGIRFDTDICIAEDRLLLFNCLIKSRSTLVLPEAHYHYIMSDFSLSRSSFSSRRLQSLKVEEEIAEKVKNIYPQLGDLSDSAMMDVMCRTYGDIYFNNACEDFSEQFARLKDAIHRYPLMKKYRFSNKKHLAAFIMARIHPAVYCFFKMKMKLQYK